MAASVGAQHGNVQATWVARALGARRVIPAHFEGWENFRGTRDDLTAAFRDAGLSEVLLLAACTLVWSILAW